MATRSLWPKNYHPPAHGIIRRFTANDIRVAETDQLHGTRSGPATKRILRRAFTQFDTRYQRLATISVSHLYNLRRVAGYQKLRQQWTKTRSTALPIGERRKPTGDGRPGYIRIDSVPRLFNSAYPRHPSVMIEAPSLIDSWDEGNDLPR